MSDAIPVNENLWWFGEWNGRPKWLRFRCARRSEERCMVPIAPQGTPNAPGGWQWDDNRESPSLTPSIHCVSCGWHGFITNGQMVPNPHEGRAALASNTMEGGGT